MTTYKAVLGVEEFQARGELFVACLQEEPEKILSRPDQLHQQMCSKCKEFRKTEKRKENERISLVEFNTGSRVVPYFSKLSTEKEKKVVKSWNESYKVKARLG